MNHLPNQKRVLLIRKMRLLNSGVKISKEAHLRIVQQMYRHNDDSPPSEEEARQLYKNPTVRYIVSQALHWYGTPIIEF